MSKKYKLNIFTVLEKISSGDIKYFKNLSNEEQKAFVPRVVCQWLTGTTDTAQIRALDYTNVYLDALYKHPKLLYLLLCSSVRTIANGITKDRKQTKRYNWVKVLGKTEPKEVIKLIQLEYGYSQRDATEVRDIFSDKQILQLAKSHGYQKNELAKIKKELR